MKPQIIHTGFIILLLLVMGTGCEKDELLDPAKAILGKWETIEMGNWPNMMQVTNNCGYKEFLPDSILREYDYETGEYFYKKYWIDSLLYECITREDGVQLVSPRYYYQFFDNYNKLRLDYKDIAAIFNTFILKRIN